MKSANGEKAIDVERKLIDIDYPSTKASATEGTLHKMYLRYLLLCFLAISVFFVGICSTLHAGNVLLPDIRSPKTPTLRDQQRFQELVHSADSSSLHEVLHEKNERYKHRTFKDTSTIAIVHQEAPEVATSIIDLAKRQAPTNGSTTGEESTSTSIPVVTSTNVVTTVATSTDVKPITSSSVTTALSESSLGSSSVPVTHESTLVSTSQATFTSTSAMATSGVVAVSSDQGATAPSPAQKTSASQSGSQSESGSGSGSGSGSSSPPTSPMASVTSFDIFTTTLPNGKPTTITLTTVVPAGQPDQTAVGGASTKTTTAGSLQTNGARAAMASANGVVGMIAILLVGAL